MTADKCPICSRPDGTYLCERCRRQVLKLIDAEPAWCFSRVWKAPPEDVPQVADETRRVDRVFRVASAVGGDTGEGWVARTEADMIAAMVHAGFVRTAVTSLARHLSRPSSLLGAETSAAIESCLSSSALWPEGLMRLRERMED